MASAMPTGPQSRLLPSRTACRRLELLEADWTRANQAVETNQQTLTPIKYRSERIARVSLLLRSASPPARALISLFPKGNH